jgi:hypothetical protein
MARPRTRPRRAWPFHRVSDAKPRYFPRGSLPAMSRIQNNPPEVAHVIAATRRSAPDLGRVGFAQYRFMLPPRLTLLEATRSRHHHGEGYLSAQAGGNGPAMIRQRKEAPRERPCCKGRLLLQCRMRTSSPFSMPLAVPIDTVAMCYAMSTHPGSGTPRGCCAAITSRHHHHHHRRRRRRRRHSPRRGQPRRSRGPRFRERCVGSRRPRS